MIQDPFALLAYLLAIIAGLFALAQVPALARVFHFVPPVLWILLIPTLSTTFGLTPREHPLYDWLQDHVLVAALFLLLLATNLRSIARLGAPALVMMLTASASLCVGAIGAVALLRHWLPSDAWTAIGALMGVWTGGYGNMLAVAASTHAPAGMVANAIIVDTLVGFGWMSLLITIAGLQGRMDRWIGADSAVLDDLNRRLHEMHAVHDRPAVVGDVAVMIGLAFGVAFLAAAAGKFLPTAGGIFSGFTWSVILASLAGILLSLTPVSRLQYAGATPIGTFLLYVVYAAIGARADLRGVASAPIFLLAGVLILIFHAGVMLLVARLMRAPAFLLVTASQANVGGMATAPIVASVYQTALPGVAVLLVPLGLAYGTFAALAVAAACRALL
jgi:uncharacterized membrane protein